MNIQRILCPVDFSDYGNAALLHASSLAREYGAELHVVHVHERPFPYVDSGFSGYVPPDDPEPERQRLTEIEPPHGGVRLVRQFVVGHPSDELVNYAQDNAIDLIVMGTHGRTGIGRLLMGSVAESVVRRAACPVLTLKNPKTETVAGESVNRAVRASSESA